MAFGTTDRVEAAPWRSQAPHSQASRSQPWRAAETPRAADPARPRFAESLQKAEPPPAPASADRTSTDRRDAGDRDRSQAARDADGTRPTPSKADAQGPRDTKTARDTKAPSSDRADAAGRRKTDKPESGEAAGSATAAAPPPEGAEGTAKAAEAQTAATAIATPTPNVPITPQPVALQPVAPQSVAPVPTGTGPADAAAGGGVQAADGLPPGTARGATLPATQAAQTSEIGEGEGEAGDAASVPHPGGSKDFLAALTDAGGSGGGQTDSTGVLPSSPAPAGATGTGAPTAAHAAPAVPQAPVAPAVPIGQVPMTIGLRSLAGSSEFQIRLDPVELGRIDVKLEIDKAKGTVATHLTVDRPDTLALLQRDAGQLQQALTQAGLDAGAGGVSLSLRGEGGGQANGQGGQSGGDGRPNTPWSGDRADTLPETAPVQRLRGYGGLDIRI